MKIFAIVVAFIAIYLLMGVSETSIFMMFVIIILALLFRKPAYEAMDPGTKSSPKIKSK